jgi:ubiquitin-conjugating enzyme E2 variant
MGLLINTIRVVLEILLTVTFAELIAGMVHWFEDAYVREDTPLIGPLLGRPNVIHHHFPRHMTRNNWWQSSYDLVLFNVCLLVTCWLIHTLTWQVWLFAILTTNANEMHKWTHRNRKENGPVISLLHDLHILQTPKHHLIHHKDPKNSHYCTMTNVLNPVLDAIHFWEALEWILARTFGLRRRPDTSLRSAGGELPDWLKEAVAPRATLPNRSKLVDCVDRGTPASYRSPLQPSHAAASDQIS